jgi:hypothetical protein
MGIDQLAAANAAPLEVRQRFGAGEQRLVVVLEYLVEQFLLAGLRLYRARQLARAASR